MTQITLTVSPAAVARIQAALDDALDGESITIEQYIVDNIKQLVLSYETREAAKSVQINELDID